MKDTRKRWKIYLLFAIGLWFGASETSAQSQSADRKRSFATLLDRQAKVAAPRPDLAAVATGLTAHPTLALNPSARSASVRPLAASAAYGVPASSPFIPPSGYGSGRDAYVEALYPLILGRPATQSEVDYWARVLASGVHADTVARLIWNSQEHKSLERSGEAPNISFRTAYDRAYAVGLANCKERLAAERRRDANE